MFFSGGVDSFYTLHQRGDEIDKLLLDQQCHASLPSPTPTDGAGPSRSRGPRS